MCERPPVLRMYGIQDSTGHLPTTSDHPAGTVPVNVDPLSTKLVNDDPAGTALVNDPPSTKPINVGTVPVNVDPPSTKPISGDPAGTVVTVPFKIQDPPNITSINDDPAGIVVDDPPDFTPINDDPAGTIPVNDDSSCAILISVDLCNNEDSDACSLSPIVNPKVQQRLNCLILNWVLHFGYYM